jgi:hypothetical protein
MIYLAGIIKKVQDENEVEKQISVMSQTMLDEHYDIWTKDAYSMCLKVEDDDLEEFSQSLQEVINQCLQKHKERNLCIE